MPVTPALVMAVLCLVGMVVTLAPMLGRDRGAEAYARRVAAVLGSRDVATGRGTRSLRRTSTSIGPVGRILLALGYDRDRSALGSAAAGRLAVATLCVAMLLGALETAALGRVALLDVPMLWLFGCRWLFRWVRERHAGRLRTQMPAALDIIVRNVRVGIPVFEGFRAVGRDAPEPTGGLFTSIAGEVAIGIPVDQALLEIAERTDLQEYRFFATALTLQGRTGGGLTETLDNLADLIRRRIAARDRGYALAAEARTSALVLACLPLLALGGLTLLNPAYIMLLFRDRLGHEILFAAILSQSCGILAMRALIRRALA